MCWLSGEWEGQYDIRENNIHQNSVIHGWGGQDQAALDPVNLAWTHFSRHGLTSMPRIMSPECLNIKQTLMSGLCFDRDTIW